MARHEINNIECEQSCPHYPCKKKICRFEYDKVRGVMMGIKEIEYWTNNMKKYLYNEPCLLKERSSN